MKLSLNWLQDFVNLKIRDPDEIARRVTAGVAEVDDVEVQGALLEHCCVGKVLSVRKHPNADRLSLCEVQTDTGVKRVVCGGPNLRVGMRVAFAHIGATVRWHGTEIMILQRATIRGEESEGMICSASELDLTDRFPPRATHEIVDLGDGDEAVGHSLREYLGLGDVVLHIDNHAITHRADLFSIYGFAREFVALGLAEWKVESEKWKVKFSKEPLSLRCLVDNKDLVSRYCSCLLTIDGPGETPMWMRHRLEAVGWRSVSLPVDITNYVATETGMPLHSFDAGDIRDEFHVREAKEGETITTLDGVERVLPKGAIVLSDREGIFDLLGIMGGLRSSTKETTRRIYLHAAVVDPIRIRKAIIATGHRTEASTVYEKGIPREAAKRGLLRAIQLFLELVPGASIVSRLEEWGDDGKAKPVRLSLERVSSVLGTEIPAKKVMKVLEDLEFRMKAGPKRTLTVTPPLHRLGDIRGQHDLIEEIGRIAGYDAIPPSEPHAFVRAPARETRMHRVRDTLRMRRYLEVMPLSLLGPTLLQRAGIGTAAGAVEINNPLGEELKFLQPSLLPGLLDHAQRNLPLLQEEFHQRFAGRLGQPAAFPGAIMRTFTLAHVFAKGQAERLELGSLVFSLRERSDALRLLEEPLFILSEDLRSVLRTIGYGLDVSASGSHPAYAHPGRSAELFVYSLFSTENVPYARVGSICELHPSVASAFELPHRAAVAFLDVDVLLALSPVTAIASLVPLFPAISYDVTMPVRLTEQLSDVLKQLRGSHEMLEDVEVKDLYTGSEVPPGSYNLTLRFMYRAKDRTLTEEEAEGIHQKVLQAVLH